MLNRLVGVAVAYLIGLGVVGYLMTRPKPDRPLTWAKAMLGAILLTALIVVAFGMLPHEWLTFADAQLKWGRRDLYFFQTYPVKVSKQAVRDIIATGIYGVNFGMLVVGWIAWQRRDELQARRRERRATRPEPVPAGTSAFGRPVSKLD